MGSYSEWLSRRAARRNAPLPVPPAAPALPNVLPGEDRDYHRRLSFEPIPLPCRVFDLADVTSPTDWTRLTRMTTARAGRRCETCGATENPAEGLLLRPEGRWDYTAGTQDLRNILCLCTDCHDTTNVIRDGTQRIDHPGALQEHFRRVTHLSPEQTEAILDSALDHWRRLGTREDIPPDLAILTAAGITATIGDTTIPGHRPGR